MHLWDGRGQAGAQDGGSLCCGVDDIDDARRAAAAIGIPYYVVNLKDEFRREVVDRFVAEYLAGRTPSPCIRCNDVLKFSLLVRRAEELGADAVATGHYARIEEAGGVRRLLRGVEKRRDQSYFLFTLTQRQLAGLVFPVGGMTKDEVRRVAVDAGLAVAAKGDSQEACFVPVGGYADFVAARAGRRDDSGEIVDTEGMTLGRHRAYYRYTIGQRRGTGLAFGAPRYVVAIDADSKRVTIGGPDDLMAAGLEADGANWVAGAPPEPGKPCLVKIRNGHRGAAARVFASEDAFTVRFDEKVRAVAPGQAAVVYAGDVVLGGGWIRGAIA
jgi:tRNA-uridine 2-sulfurtransferase